jgi:hypothetical protein
MSLAAVLSPLFVEIALTFGLLIWLGPQRRNDLASGKTRSRDIALRQPNWPPRTMQVANSFSNQFELPVLFYVLTILAWDTRHAGIAFVIMAWLFVLFRLVHAYIHVTSNIVRLRGAAYGVAAVVLLLMWLIFAVQVLTGT